MVKIPPEVKYATAGLGYSIATIGVVLNSCSIFVFCRNRKNLHGQSIAPLLFFLAIIDFIACSYGITTQSSKYLFDHWPLRPFGLTEDEKVNDANCKFNYTILEFIYASSIYLIFLVNVNRAYSLYNQNKALNWFDMRGTSKSVALVFIIALLITIIPALDIGLGEHKFCPDHLECSIVLFHRQYSINPLTFGIGFFAILTISIPINVYIHTKSKSNVEEKNVYLRKVENIADPGHIKHHEELLEHEKSASKTVKYLSICFAIMFLPICILGFNPLTKDDGRHVHLEFEWHLFAYVLFWCNFAVKPVIYVLTNKFLKDAFYASFRRKSQTNEQSEVQLETMTSTDSDTHDVRYVS